MTEGEEQYLSRLLRVTGHSADYQKGKFRVNDGRATVYVADDHYKVIAFLQGVAHGKKARTG